MGVYQDYMDHRWSGYFTAEFREKHLMPFHYIPRGGHKEARQRARDGNVALNARFRREQDTGLNSIIYDIDPDHGTPRQVLRLMQEVEMRNEEKYYDGSDLNKNRILTLDEYDIQMTGHGSRQWFVKGRFLHGVCEDPKMDRYIIFHMGGV